jgi:hypothetical protein
MTNAANTMRGYARIATTIPSASRSTRTREPQISCPPTRFEPGRNLSQVTQGPVFTPSPLNCRT